MIRATRRSDIEEVIQLASEVFSHLPYKKYGDFREWEKFIDKNISMVEESDGKIIGHTALEQHEHYGVLSRSFIHKNYRNTGIYNSFIQRRIDMARNMGLLLLETKVVTYTDVVQKTFIEKYGFIPVGLELLSCESDVMNTGQRESLVVLRKPLMIPDTIPEYRAGFVPQYKDNYWSYSPVPKDFDRSKIELTTDTIESLNLRYFKQQNSTIL
jgi:N-acetylglutamate synthase-like GNAT family acetyltransferase